MKKLQQISKLYLNARIPSLKEQRALRVGDVINAFYADSTKPIREVVVECCENGGDIHDVRTISETNWKSKKRPKHFTEGIRSLNTDRWELTGQMEFAARSDYAIPLNPTTAVRDLHIGAAHAFGGVPKLIYVTAAGDIQMIDTTIEVAALLALAGVSVEG